MQTLKENNHKNLLKGYITFDDVRYHFIVMEYCSKGDLQKFINNYKLKNNINDNMFFDQDEALDIFYHLLMAVNWIQN